jgi:aminopeptidase N
MKKKIRRLTAQDVHSFGNPNELRVTHARLQLTVDLENERLKGKVRLNVKRLPGCPNGAKLVLDTKHLDIEQVFAHVPGQPQTPTPFILDEARTTKMMGTPLVITMPAGANAVTVVYNTKENAEALQWLPAAGARQHKFLFTQSESIMGRTWIPLQDSPAVRMTYEATVSVPDGVTAVMASQHLPSRRKNVYRFAMRNPIPSYLIALAVGELEFRSLGPRTGVYASPDVVGAAAWEFAEAEKMIKKIERRYGPYVWGRWDILVLPAGFPLGGMENPMLTFATPTLLAGDRSLVDVAVHELAHSWSGNKVTNATWRDFWLNEGFTTYIQRRIIEDLYGVEYADMQLVLGEEDLQEALNSLPPEDQILHIRLTDRDPDEALTDIAYEKGALFARVMERAFGRRRWDKFLCRYFDHFEFQSITTEMFEEYLTKELLAKHPRLARKVNVKAWLYEPGLPPHEKHTSRLLAAVEAAAAGFVGKTLAPHAIETKDWSAHEWLRFLRQMPKLSPEQMAELDRVFAFTERTNAEIAHQWLLMAVRNDYRAADERLASFLATVGRRKFVLPLYKELAKTAAGKERARTLYEQSRSIYHFLVTRSVEDALAK